MAKLPRVSGKNTVKALKQAGFEVARTKGSHFFMKHSDGRTTVVPIHPREVIGPGLLSKILNDTELSKEELIKLLK